jgi:hypothetical protein
VKLGERLECVWEAKFCEGPKPAVNNPEDEVGSDSLTDDGAAEPTIPRVVGEINVAPGIQLLELLWIEKALGEHAGVAGFEQRGIGKNGFQIAVPPPGGLGVTAEVDVRGARVLGVLEKLVNVGDLHPIVEILFRGF